MRLAVAQTILLALLMTSTSTTTEATTFDVGPGHPYATPSAVPWESLEPGDSVRIHWRSTPYHDKWVICRQGTAELPIVISGVPGPGGELPIIDANGALTRLALDYWGENRAVIKIGGASIPADTMPRYIVLEHLDVRGARAPNAFVDDNGATQSYAANAAAVWIERGEHITVRNVRMHDSGNGLFVSSSAPYISRQIVIEGNAIYDNGNVGSIYEHNTYTEALGIIYQYNYFGPTKAGAGGNNLKDRSAGLVVRYNWIAGGNRQLDLVETGNAAIQADPSYRATMVYGNVLVEPDGAGNRQIAHYGGDSGAAARYRKGSLFFYANTLVSTRGDRTTLFRLSTSEERADVRNNIFYVAAAGSTLSVLDASGIVDLSHNWFKPGRVDTFGTLTGTINDDGTSVIGSAPGFVDETAEDFRLTTTSANVDAGGALAPGVSQEHVVREYVKHQASRARANAGSVDIGAFELESGAPADLVITTSALVAGEAKKAYTDTLGAAGGVPPYFWQVQSGTLPGGLSLNYTSGVISGTPTRSGNYSVTLQATDSQGPADTASRTFSIAIAAPPPRLVVSIVTSTLPTARRDSSYSQPLEATGGMTPYTWRIVSGRLPAGMTLNGATGVISGRPTRLGTFNFTVRVGDGQDPPAAAKRALSMTVVE